MKAKSLKVFTGVFLVWQAALALVQAITPSFDRGKAATWSEIEVCRDDKLSVLDRDVRVTLP